MAKKKIVFKEIQIGEIFEFPETNSKITKEFCNQNKGEIPVYASSKNEKSTLGVIKDNMQGVKYYENCLSWNRNGSVGYVFIRNHRFSTNEDHRAMVIKPEYAKTLDKLYLKFEIEKKLLLNGFSFLNKCGVAKIQEVNIEIPAEKNGNFDLTEQKKLAEKYSKIKELKLKLQYMYDEISELNISLDNSYSTKEVPISELFDIKKGNAKYTQEYMRNHKGEYPIYSSQTVDEGVIGKIDSFDYDNECLTWTTDGIYAGTVFYRFGKFSMTTHCGALFLKEEFRNKIDLKYVLYQLSLHLKEYATGEGNKRVTVNIMEKVSIKVIVDKKGNFDIIKQKEIADKYFKVEKIKTHIKDEFLEVISPSINIVEE